MVRMCTYGSLVVVASRRAWYRSAEPSVSAGISSGFAVSWGKYIMWEGGSMAGVVRFLATESPRFCHGSLVSIIVVWCCCRSLGVEWLNPLPRCRVKPASLRSLIWLMTIKGLGSGCVGIRCPVCLMLCTMGLVRDKLWVGRCDKALLSMDRADLCSWIALRSGRPNPREVWREETAVAVSLPVFIC